MLRHHRRLWADRPKRLRGAAAPLWAAARRRVHDRPALTFGGPALLFLAFAASGAIRLAKSVACENQAFQWGSAAIGLQFHLETTPNLLDALVVNCRDELVESEYVQSESRIRGASSEDFENINLIMAQVLTYLTDR